MSNAFENEKALKTHRLKRRFFKYVLNDSIVLNGLFIKTIIIFCSKQYFIDLKILICIEFKAITGKINDSVNILDLNNPNFFFNEY